MAKVSTVNSKDVPKMECDMAESSEPLDSWTISVGGNCWTRTHYSHEIEMNLVSCLEGVTLTKSFSTVGFRDVYISFYLLFPIPGQDIIRVEHSCAGQQEAVQTLYRVSTASTVEEKMSDPLGPACDNGEVVVTVHWESQPFLGITAFFGNLCMKGTAHAIKRNNLDTCAKQAQYMDVVATQTVSETYDMCFFFKLDSEMIGYSIDEPEDGISVKACKDGVDGAKTGAQVVVTKEENVHIDDGMSWCLREVLCGSRVSVDFTFKNRYCDRATQPTKVSATESDIYRRMFNEVAAECVPSIKGAECNKKAIAKGPKSVNPCQYDWTAWAPDCDDFEAANLQAANSKDSVYSANALVAFDENGNVNSVFVLIAVGSIIGCLSLIALAVLFYVKVIKRKNKEQIAVTEEEEQIDVDIVMEEGTAVENDEIVAVTQAQTTTPNID